MTLNKHQLSWEAKFVKGYNKFNFYLILSVFVLALISLSLVSVFAMVGLAATQKEYPNMFHGHYLNYANLWVGFSIWTPASLVYTILSVFALWRKLPEPQTKTMPKGWKSK